MMNKWITLFLLMAMMLLASCQSDDESTIATPQTEVVTVIDDNDETTVEGEPSISTETNDNADDGSETDENTVDSKDQDLTTTADSQTEEVQQDDETASSIPEESDTITESDEGSGENGGTSLIDPEKEVSSPMHKSIEVEEVRAVWLTYLELQEVFSSDSEEAYRNYITEVVTNMRSAGLNTLIYQVRPFADALYPSEIFPTSYVITGTEGDALRYDPFGIAVEIAHEYDIRIEAWINPYRIRTAQSDVPLSDDNIASAWYQDGFRRVLRASSGTLVYNPASDEVQSLVVSGVQEILDLYDVDGIHLDDYFYPTTETAFDETEYLSFYHTNDAYTQAQWRTRNVNKLIRRIYEVVKTYDPAVTFGISPDGAIEANLTQHYADVALWMSEEGYVDYLMPQIYYGFDHSSHPFSEVLMAWHSLNEIGIDIIPGIAAYKVGTVDTWAGEGADEWVSDEGILAEMIKEIKDQPSDDGYALYRYAFLFDPSEDLQERMTYEIEAMTMLQE